MMTAAMAALPEAMKVPVTIRPGLSGGAQMYRYAHQSGLATYWIVSGPVSIGFVSQASRDVAPCLLQFGLPTPTRYAQHPTTWRRTSCNTFVQLPLIIMTRGKRT